MDEKLNMSIRRFLKEVGVTSQQAIEDAVRDSGRAGPFHARVVLTIDGLPVEHVIEGRIEGHAS